LPKFPQKKWFGNKNQRFIEQRMRNLNSYYAALLSQPELGRSAIITDLMAPTTPPINLVVLGGVGVGKS